MSRAYRIAVRESLRRVVRARDHVSTTLEILDILPRERLAELLAAELEKRGFKQKGKELVRSQDGVVATVDPQTGSVTVQAELEKQVEVDGERVGRSYDDMGPDAKKTKQRLREELREDLEKQVCDREAELQTKATAKLEQQLGDLRAELDQVVNRVTAEALKEKARQLGQIKEISEDAESGALTIVLEV